MVRFKYSKWGIGSVSILNLWLWKIHLNNSIKRTRCLQSLTFPDRADWAPWRAQRIFQYGSPIGVSWRIAEHPIHRRYVFGRDAWIVAGQSRTSRNQWCKLGPIDRRTISMNGPADLWSCHRLDTIHRLRMDIVCSILCQGRAPRAMQPFCCPNRSHWRPECVLVCKMSRKPIRYPPSDTFVFKISTYFSTVLPTL